MTTFAVEGDLPDDRLTQLIEDAQRYGTKFVLATSTGRYKMSSLQRKRSTEGFGTLTRIATILTDPITRGVITAFGWLGLNIRSYPWNKVDAACEYIAPPDVAPGEIFALLDEVRRGHFNVLGEKDESPLSAAK